MGEYLRIGITGSFNASLDQFTQEDNKLRDVCSKIAREVTGEDFFEVQKESWRYVWRPAPEHFSQNLLLFLNKFYKDFYGRYKDVYEKECQPILDYLKTKPTFEEFVSWEKTYRSIVISIDERIPLFVLSLLVRQETRLLVT